MATVQDIITRALRKIGVGAVDETPSDADLAKGLVDYNSMIHAWTLAGVDLSHTDQVLTDTFSLGDAYQEGVVYNLAARMSPDYTVPANFDADDWFRKFQAANMTIAKVTLDRALSEPPSKRMRDGDAGALDY